jgi:DNA-binding transcriptional ArsR family regulator
MGSGAYLIAHPTARRIFGALKAKPLSVSEFEKVLELPEPVVSHHVLALSGEGLISGDWMYSNPKPKAVLKYSVTNKVKEAVDDLHSLLS